MSIFSFCSRKRSYGIMWSPYSQKQCQASNDCQLPGIRRCAFSAVVPGPWNIFPLNIRMTPILRLVPSLEPHWVPFSCCIIIYSNSFKLMPYTVYLYCTAYIILIGFMMYAFQSLVELSSYRNQINKWVFKIEQVINRGWNLATSFVTMEDSRKSILNSPICMNIIYPKGFCFLGNGLPLFLYVSFDFPVWSRSQISWCFLSQLWNRDPERNQELIWRSKKPVLFFLMIS